MCRVFAKHRRIMVLSQVADSRRADKGKEGSKRGNLCMSHASQPAVLIKNGHFYGKAGKEQRNYLSERKPTQTKPNIWTGSLIKGDLLPTAQGRESWGGIWVYQGKMFLAQTPAPKTIPRRQQEVLPRAQKNLIRRQENRGYEA